MYLDSVCGGFDFYLDDFCNWLGCFKWCDWVYWGFVFFMLWFKYGFWVEFFWVKE